jgi:ArsR family transcriptional regulator
MAVDVSSTRSSAEVIAQLARVLSDPVRVQIIEILRGRRSQVCQCELNPVFDISQPTLSHHVKKLSDAGIVDVERRGRWAYYSLNPEALEVLAKWLS